MPATYSTTRLNNLDCQMRHYAGAYNRGTIRMIAQRLSDDLYHDGSSARLEVAIEYANRQYRSGKFTKAGDAISLFNPDEAGGCDGKHNDCFYDCLKAAFPDKVTKHFSKPWIFKRFFKLERDAKVPLNLRSEIEDKLKMCINVKGDYCKTSTKEYVRVVNLKLTNEHYTLDKEGAFEPKGIILKRYNDDRILPVMAYKWDDDNDQVQLYDGTNYSTMSKAALIDELKKQKFDGKCRYIKVEAAKKRKSKKPIKTLEETWLDFIKDADALKEGTDGIIDLYFTGSNINKAALNLFSKYNKHVIPDIIEQEEAKWIAKASNGPLRFADTYTGPLYKYDVSGMYAAIMRSSTFSVPIKKGEFHQLTDEELSAKSGIPFGIYRAIIKGEHRAFRPNDNNYYTHYDLTFAQELGLTFNLINDNKHNALLYPTGRVNGNMLFGKFIDQVLDWKKADVPRAKELYQRLWGALSKYNKSKEYVNIKAEKNVVVDKELGITDIYFKASLPENHSIDAMNITHNGNVMVKSINNLDMFDTPFARIMPFIIARGRKMIGTIIKDDIDSIKRVHTDGFVSTKPWTEKTGKKSLDYPKLGKECGDLRYEGYCPDAIVKNMAKVEGTFIV
ncbi:hypothetical protein SAMD00019534_123960 [Acytostelium subglobosum LB1]|uniref:hypothetical protein n=1 Tax=Acytostelium subglobosum LB1 TaxID=1410327 RepID=UPI0006449FF9|nr:hypothetical protein SAMD00019534_123960 [Acytostelium subglobosum LB1]GAM29220.1 hypothetical protein SAMD00019534_123960 [Acytostelium subglobosum LB1]|eukprot:XP_012747794.1 hypothetical protein SAMD00019534_123960 [Acytostelium subglobosum LB1]